MRIAGIDYSLRCPAICVFDGDKRFCSKLCRFHFMSSTKRYEFLNQQSEPSILWHEMKSFTNECERYSMISDWALQIVSDCDLICIEDYAFAAKGKVFHIGENTGVLKYRLWSAEPKLNYVSVPPTKIKKFGTGRGNARKEEVYAAFTAETHIDLLQTLQVKAKQIKSPVSDVADSYYICKYGHYLALKDS